MCVVFICIAWFLDCRASILVTPMVFFFSIIMQAYCDTKCFEISNVAQASNQPLNNPGAQVFRMANKADNKS